LKSGPNPGSTVDERTARLYVQAREAVENSDEPEAITVLEKIMRSVGRAPEPESHGHRR